MRLVFSQHGVEFLPQYWVQATFVFDILPKFHHFANQLVESVIDFSSVFAEYETREFFLPEPLPFAVYYALFSIRRRFV
jgi:hypothetical protein